MLRIYFELAANKSKIKEYKSKIDKGTVRGNRMSTL